VLDQSSCSRRARSKFDVSDPLIVHVLLLTNEYMFYNIASLILGILSVTVHFFLVRKTHR